MKLRLTQPGWESYSGQMGVIQFKDGVSEGDVLPLDAVRVSAVMLCEWEDGSASSVTQWLLDEQNTPAPDLDELKAKEAAKAKEAEPAKPQVPKFTEEELARIADEDGIAGLRAIAEPYGIRNNSIRGLMDALIKAGE